MNDVSEQALNPDTCDHGVELTLLDTTPTDVFARLPEAESCSHWAYGAHPSVDVTVCAVDEDEARRLAVAAGFVVSA